MADRHCHDCLATITVWPTSAREPLLYVEERAFDHTPQQLKKNTRRNARLIDLLSDESKKMRSWLCLSNTDSLPVQVRQLCFQHELVWNRKTFI